MTELSETFNPNIENFPLFWTKEELSEINDQDLIKEINRFDEDIETYYTEPLSVIKYYKVYKKRTNLYLIRLF